MKQGISDNPNFTPVTNSWDKDWVGNLFLAAGYVEQEITNGNVQCRGGVNNIILKDDHVIITDETAWGPNDESMKEMLDRFYPGLSLCFKCEEPGMCVFINTDKTGQYLPERYLVECWSDGQYPYLKDVYEPCTTEDEAFQILSDSVGVPVDVLKTYCDGSRIESVNWDEWMEKKSGKNIPEDCNWGGISINRYEEG